MPSKKQRSKSKKMCKVKKNSKENEMYRFCVKTTLDYWLDELSPIQITKMEDLFKKTKLMNWTTYLIEEDIDILFKSDDEIRTIVREIRDMIVNKTGCNPKDYYEELMSDCKRL